MQSIRSKYNELLKKCEEMSHWDIADIAKEIHDSESWQLCRCHCEELCYRADLQRAWLNATGETFKCVLVAAALELGIPPEELGVII